jgi:DNA-binding MarR family transcriptional regulator
MKIEEEIKQLKFKNVHQKAIINIIYTSNWLNQQHHKMLKPYGISIQQYNILRILKGQYPKPASVNLLIERMLDKMSNASRLVEKLKQKKLVERRECPDDRRQVDVIITNKGLDVLESIDTHMINLEKKYFTINEKEAETVSDILDKLRG